MTAKFNQKPPATVNNESEGNFSDQVKNIINNLPAQEPIDILKIPVENLEWMNKPNK